MLTRDVKAVDVVEVAVVGLGDDRQCPEDVRLVRQRFEMSVLDLPLDDRVAHDADGVRVGQHDRPLEKSGLGDPGGARHLAVAVQRVPAGEDRVVLAAARQDGRHAGAHGPLAALQRSFAADQRHVPDFDAGDVGDRVQGPGRAVEWHPQVARADG